MLKLPLSFYQRKNVLRISRELVGKLLVTNWDNQLTSGRIVEVEAYEGMIDRASHAWGGRRTARNKIMYGDGGYAYVYLCYGIHHLFNVVTHFTGTPHAILVRALEPVEGLSLMLERTKKREGDPAITRGPGNLTRALGITTKHTGFSLLSDRLFIADDGVKFKNAQVGSSPRIGVDYAGTHAQWPYRFYVKDNPFVSGKPR